MDEVPASWSQSEMSKPEKSRCRACERPSTKRGLCNTHYIRMRRWGQLDPEVQFFRERQKHPLYSKWRTALKCGAVPEWQDFEAFLSDVGEAPHSDSRLRKKMPGEPIGPMNFRWVSIRTREEKLAIQRAGAARIYYGRKISGEPVWTDTARDIYYRKKFGIGLDEYNGLLADQNGVCAICLKEDDRRLAVDHCHRTNRVRGLLCSSCNLSIGRMGDDPEQLRRAAAYLLREIET